MTNIIDHDIFVAYILLVLALVGIAVSVTVGIMQLRYRAQRRRSEAAREGTAAAMTEALRVSAILISRTTGSADSVQFVPHGKSGRTNRSKAVATATDVLKVVDGK